MLYGIAVATVIVIFVAGAAGGWVLRSLYEAIDRDEHAR